MTNDFRSYNVIYIVYDRKNENHWSLLVIRYSLLITRNANTYAIKSQRCAYFRVVIFSTGQN